MDSSAHTCLPAPCPPGPRLPGSAGNTPHAVGRQKGRRPAGLEARAGKNAHQQAHNSGAAVSGRFFSQGGCTRPPCPGRALKESPSSLIRPAMAQDTGILCQGRKGFQAVSLCKQRELKSRHQGRCSGQQPRGGGIGIPAGSCCAGCLDSCPSGAHCPPRGACKAESCAGLEPVQTAVHSQSTSSPKFRRGFRTEGEAEVVRSGASREVQRI